MFIVLLILYYILIEINLDNIYQSNSLPFTKSFEVINKLGEGAYGQVYKVKHKDNYEEYAVKICELNGNVYIISL